MSTHENKNARKLISLIEEFRKLHGEMQAQQMIIFLMIMGKPTITMRELEDMVGLSGAAVSRNVAALSKIHRKGKPGHDLIIAYEDPDDRRYKKLKPTHKGIQVYNTLLEILAR